MSDEQNTKKHRYKLVYKARDSGDFQRALETAKEMFGHRGKENGWWWNVQGKYKDRTIIFKFDVEADATLLRLCL